MVQSAWGVTKGQGGAISGRRITLGRWNTTGKPENPNNVTRTFFNTEHLLPEDLRLESGGAERASLPRTPNNRVTPLSIWRSVLSKNPSTHFYVAKLRCRQTVDSRTALEIALKLVFRLFWRLAKSWVSTKFYTLHSYFFAAFPFPFRVVIRHFKE